MIIYTLIVDRQGIILW